jgi:hypothetical protein
MSLHPGEKGVCPIHGEYDEFCGDCRTSKQQLEQQLRELPEWPYMPDEKEE